MGSLLEIIEAKYMHDYTLQLKFNTQEECVVDLMPMLKEDRIGIFEPLKNLSFFRHFRVDYTLCWGDEIDVAPEYIYFLAHKNDPKYQSLFQEWGYLT